MICGGYVRVLGIDHTRFVCTSVTQLGAFDNAWHPGILGRLWKLKCPLKIYSMVRDISGCTAQVTLRNSCSSKRVTKGCPLGSVSAT